ncbi:Solute carrier family 35 member G1 [Halotydeus destructor]|nr:Solute carrier family 35 member G1 [Halotydeus destructor]
MLKSMQSADEQADEGVIIGQLRKFPLAGIILATVSGVIFATANFCVSLLPHVHPFTVLITRSIIQLLVFVPAAIFSESSIFGVRGERLTLYINGAIGAIAIGAAYSAFQVMPLGDASTIVQSMPVFATLLACLFLNESCKAFQVVMVIMTCGGVIVISQPKIFSIDEIDITVNQDAMVRSNLRLEGTVFALTAALALGVSFTLMRKLQKTPAGVTIIWLSLMSIVLALTHSAVLHLLFQTQFKFAASFSRSEWSLLLANGVCGVFAQLTLTIALKIEEAGLTSIARSSDIVVAYIYQILYLSQPLESTSVVGSALILTCVIASALAKLKQPRWSRDTDRLECHDKEVGAESQIIIPIGYHCQPNYASLGCL